MTDPSAEKSALRKDLFARRKAAHALRNEKTPSATARLLTAILDLGAPPGVVIAGYRPIRTEIDPTPAMTELHGKGARLCVPVIEAAARPLLFREWTPTCEMTEGPFGAQVPAAGDWLVPSILITPLVGWDRHGWRLGYGGGFYDRTLETLRAAASTSAIGFAYDAQELETAPQEPTDQRLNAVVTETRTINLT